MQLHRDVFGEGFPDHAGKWGTEVIRVGEDECCEPRYVPARTADVMYQFGARLTDLEANPYVDEKWFETLVDLAAYLHVEVLGVHPFVDGNGRIARLLLNFVLRRFNLFPINIRIEDGYLGHLRAARRGEPAGLVAMIMKLIFESVDEFETSVAQQQVAAHRRRPHGKHH